jgi:hypothetical protein
MVSWDVLTAEFTRSFATDEDEAAWLARHIATVTGMDPLVVDLCSGDISVVKILAPELSRIMGHHIPRPAAAAS